MKKLIIKLASFVLPLVVGAGVFAVSAPQALASISTIVIGSQTPNPLSPGSSATYTVTTTAGGSNHDTKITAVTGLPSGAAFSSDCIVSNNSGSTHNTLTVTTTGITPVGTSTLTITVTMSQVANGTCSGTVNDTNNTHTTTLVVGLPKVNTTTTITSSLSTATVVGQGYAVNVSVARSSGSNQPSGTVTVSDGSATCTTPNITGSAGTSTASCNLTSTTAGAKIIVATYNGDSNFNTSISAGVAHTVNAASTTTALASSVNPSVFGQSVTFTATVAATAPGVGIPTGTVTFKDGATTLGAGTLNGSGVATFSSSALSVSSHSITASYATDGNFSSSVSSAVSQVINKANSTTAITSANPNPSTVNSAYTVSYTVTAAAPGGGTPTGNVTVSDGTDSCSGTVAAGTCSLTSTTIGSKTLTASYAGDINFNSGSGTIAHTVNPLQPDLTVTKTNNVSGSVNTNGSFNWTITITNSGAANATFSSGATILTDNLPSSNATYGTPTAVDGGSTTGTVSCSVASNNLSCTASGGSVLIPVNGTITITLPVTAGISTGTLSNPRSAGVCSVDPNNVVSESNKANNSCSNSVSVVSLPDLTVTQTNSVGGNATIGTPFNWVFTITNIGTANATIGGFFNTQTVFTGNLPTTGATYGSPTNTNSNMSCSISSNTLSCTSNVFSSGVSIAAGGTITITLPVTPTVGGTLVSPRSGGICEVDPNNQVTESNKSNNTCSNTVTVGGLGTLKIVKNTIGSDGSFTFNTTGTVATSTIVTTSGLTGTKSLALNPGSYSLTEVVPAGWSLTSSSCDSGTPGSFTITSNNTVTCTFTDTKLPTITVNKILSPSNDAGKFDLQIDSATAGTGANSGNGGTTGAVTSTVGAHTVGEIAHAGSNLSNYTSVIGGDCASNGSITLSAGQNAVCTITNSRNATITIQTNTQGGDGTFNYTVTGPTTASPSVTTVNGVGTNSVSVGLGTYSVSETVPNGWTLGIPTCDNGTPASMTLSAGASVTCTFPNSKQANLTVNQVVLPANDSGKFNLTIDGSTAGTGGNVSNGGTTGAVLVSAGAHTVGYTAVAGTNLSDYDTVISGDCASGGNITLASGQSAVCTITSTKKGHIVVDKITNPSGDPTSFNFTPTGTGYGAFSLTDAATPNDQELSVGSYSVTESSTTGWDLTSLVCTDPTNNSSVNLAAGVASLTLDPGEIINCAFTNTKRGTLHVTKSTNPASNTTAFTIDASSSDGGTITTPHRTTLATNHPEDFDVMGGKTYSVAEAASSDWAEYISACQSVVVPAGQTVTCNIANKDKVPPVITLVGNNPETVTYGDTYTDAGATATDNIDGNISANIVTVNPVDTHTVGDYTVTYNVSDAAGNAATQVTRTVHVVAKEITVTADAKSKTYGDADPALTYQVSSGALVSGDSFIGALTRDSGEHVGSYGITQGTLALTSNYNLTYVGANLSIGTKTISVTVNPHQGKIYGSADPALTYIADPLVGTDSFSGALDRAPGKNVGSYPIGQGDLSAGSNYTINFTGDNFVISSKDINVTADSQTKVYGAADPTLTYVSSDLSAPFTGKLHRAPGEGIGAYAIDHGSLDAGTNYTIHFTGNNLTITPAALNVAADHQTKVYGAADPILTYQVSGLQSGDATNSVLSGTLSRDAGETVASYAITQGSLVANSNYTVSFTGSTLDITKATLTVTPDGGKTKTYGDAFSTFTGNITGPQNGDIFTATYASLGAPASADAGSYDITVDTVSGDKIFNYNVVKNSAINGLTITQADSVTLITCPGSVSYSGSAQTPCTVSVTGAGGLKLTPDAVYSNNTAAGTATAIYTFAGDADHKGSSDSKNFDITKATLTITAKDASKKYGDAVTFAGTEFSNSALQAGDSITSVSLNSNGAGATADVSGSPYDITPSAAVGSGLDNYDISYLAGHLTVNSAALTVTADNASRAFGVANPPFTGGMVGVKNSDPITGTYDSVANATSPVGPYDIVPTLSDGGSGKLNNYTVTKTNGTLTVTAADQTINVTQPAPATAVYKTTFDVAASSDSGLDVSILASGVCSGSGSNTATLTITSGTGTCTVTYSQAGDGNHNPATSVTENVTAQKADQTLSFTTPPPSSANFKDSFAVVAASTSGLPVTYGSIAPLSNVLGQYTMNSGTGSATVQVDQPGDDNYNPAKQLSTTVDAGKLGQTINFTKPTDATYGDAPFSLTATGGASDNPVTFVLKSGPATVAGQKVTITGAGTVVITASQAGDDNYNSANDVDQNFNVAKADPTIVVTPYSVTYNGAAHTAVGTATGVLGESLTGLNLSTTTHTKAGTYDTDSWTFTDATGNYNDKTGTLTDSIAGQALTVTAQGVDKVYDGTTGASVTLANNALNGDVVNAHYSTAAFDDKNAGKGKNISVSGISIDGADAGNYTLGNTTANTTANISPLAVTVTAQTNSKVYDGDTTAAAVPSIAPALASGDTSSFIEIYDTADVGTAKTLTPSGSISDGNGGNNYSVTFANDTTGVVSQGSVNITISGQSQIYDATAKSVSVKVAPNVSFSVTYNGSATAPTNAGSYPVVVTITDPNYSGSANDTLAISKAPLAINAVTNSKVYDGDTTAAAVPATVGLQGSDSVSGLSETYDTASVGTGKTLTVASGYTVKDGNGGNNYAVTVQPDSTGVITAASAPVTLSGLAYTYDGTAKSATVTTVPAKLNVNVTYNGSAASPTNAGTYAVVATITDPNYSGTASGSLVISKADQTISFSALGDKHFGDANFSVSATGGTSGNAVTFLTASTACTVSADGSVVHILSVGSCDIAADQAGNTNYNSATTIHQTFNITDNTAPIIAPHKDVAVEATSAAGATVTYTAPTATDDVDASVTVTCLPASGVVFPIGSTLVTCNAKDSSNNAAIPVTFNVIVKDTTAPTVTVPADVTVEATGANTPVTFAAATATDIVDGAVTATCDHNSGDSFPVGSTLITCSATDAHGNKGTATFHVIVTSTTAPVVTVPSDITAEATSAAGASVTFSATASDVVDGSITPTCSPLSGSTFLIGSTKVTCSATDSHSNTGSASFNVIVKDTTAPVFTAPSDITAEATSASGAVVTYTTPSATDAVDGTDVVNCLPASGSTFALGPTTVTCNATDAAGNITSHTFKVTVQTTSAPVITLNGVSPMNLNVGGSYVEPGATATDLVDGTDPVTVGGDTVNTAVVGTYHVTYDSVDSHGNHATQVIRTVNVNQLPAPIITNEQSASPSQTSITITWTTDHPATSRVVYDILSHSTLGTAPNYGYANSTVEDSTLVTSHSVVVSGLTAGTQYFFRAVSHGSPEAVAGEISASTNNAPAQTGTLTVVKNTINGNGTFNFAVTGPSASTPAITTVAGTGTTGKLTLNVGSYTVSEGSLPTGWTQTSVVCVDNATAASINPAQFNLASSQDVTCTFTNTKQSAQVTTLTVNTVMVPSNDTGKFNLTIDGATAGTGANVSNGGTTGAVVLTPGLHTAGETAGVGTSLSNYSITVSGDCSSSGNVTLTAGQNKVCTITNTRKATPPGKGKIKVVKITTFGNGTFSFTGDLGKFSISTSGGTGSQTFSNLPTTNTYSVNETAQSGWTQTSNTCQNVAVVANQTVICTITNTKIQQSSGKIRGQAFEDKNGNSNWDNQDTVQSGWTVYLDTNNNGVLDSGEASTVTDQNGVYLFQNLPAGNYHVREVAKAGWQLTYPTSGQHNINLGPNQTVQDQDFGNFHLGTISGQKFNDLNGNGRKDAGEPGLKNWTIKLTKQGGSSVTTTTDANGNYSFINLTAGIYTVTEVQQTGWVQKTSSPAPVKVSSGTTSTGNNFGNHKK